MAGEPLELATAYVSLVASAQGIRKDVNKTLGAVEGDFGKAGKRSGRRFSDAMRSGVAAVGATLAAVGAKKFLTSAITEASDLGESLNAVAVTYGDNAKGIEKLGKNAANAMGLSTTQFNGIAVQFAGFTETIAGKGGDVVGTLEKLSGRGADFASVMNIDVSDAMQLFQSGLAGETEPLRRYGIDLSAAAVENYAMAEGIAKAGEQMTESQKVQARYGLLMEKTSKVQGDFSNTSTSLANSQRRLKANWDNMKATIGAALLPVLEKVSNWAVDKGLPMLADLGRQVKKMDFSPFIDAFGDVEVSLEGFQGFVPTLQPTLDLLTTGFKWAADNVDLLAKALPFLIAAFVAYKAAQAANNVLGRESVVGFGLQLASTVALTVSNRQLAKSLLSVSAAQTTSNASTKVGLLTRLRSTAATVAHTVAEKAASAAKKAGAAAQWLLNAALSANPIGIVVALIAGLVASLVLLYKKNETVRRIVDKVWAGIRSAIKAAVDWFLTSAWPSMRNTFDSLRDKAVRVKDSIVSAFESIRRGINDKYNSVRSIFDKFKNALGSVQNKFTSARDGISSAWGKIVLAIGRPINSVIDKINNFLRNLRNGLNKIPGVNLTGNWVIPKIILSSGSGSVNGGPNQALAAGGIVRGPWRGPKADNVLGLDEKGIPTARVNPGEMVLSVAGTKKLVRKIGRTGLNMLNHGQLPGLADGGIVDKTGDWLSGLWSDGKSWVKKYFKKFIPDWGDSWVGQTARGVVNNLDLGKVTEWLTSKAGGDFGGKVNYPGRFGQHPSGQPWQRTWAMIRSVVPNAIMTSNFRPGSITASGIPSLHGLARAVDWVTPGMRGMVDAFRRVGRLRPWSQHFFTQAGPGSQHGIVDSIIRATHRDHAHTALASGGMVADRGAVLAPGLNLLDNRTGGPEPLGRLDSKLTLSDTSVDDLRTAFEKAITEAVRLYVMSRRQLGEDD